MHKETFISIMRWAYLVSWCFAFLGFTDTTFLQTRAVATLCWACQFMPFLQQLLLTSMSHFGDWNILDFLLIIFYGDLWLVVFYITVVIFSGCHKLLPYDSKLNKCCVWADCSTDQPSPCLSPCSQASLFSKTNDIKIMPINNLPMASKCSSKRITHLSL